MLRSGNLSPEKSRKALETIERNAKAQAVLIEDILDVSRIITGKLRLETQPIELGTIARAAVEAVRPSAEAKGIQLETSIAALPAGFRGDPSRLQQVIWNLLSNAIKFTPAGGHVSLSVDELGASAGGRGARATRASWCATTGAASTANFVPFIFDRFRQVDSTSKRAHGGLGLGLAIVRHLVELHGGAIGVESAGEGRGATFTVTLPRAEKSDGEDGARRRADRRDRGAPAQHGVHARRRRVRQRRRDRRDRASTACACCWSTTRPTRASCWPRCWSSTAPR